ncbi:MAG: potassium-transporting ATPase subunit KdpA [Thermoplasmataceae archaeon]
MISLLMGESVDSQSNSSFWTQLFAQDRLLSGSIIILLYIIIATLFALAISNYIKKIYRGEPTWLDPVAGPVVSFFEKLFHEGPEKEMTFRAYFKTLLLFNAYAGIVAFVVLYFQNFIPFSHTTYKFSLSLAFNTVSSFLTNTDLQHYSSPFDLSYFSVTFVIIGLMFLSAATGFSASMAFIRGIIQDKGTIGNFYHDFLVSTFYLIFPLVIVSTVILLLLGVPSTLNTYVIVHPFLGIGSESLPLGPVAPFEAIKNIGTNGGGFYAANAGYPLENPNWFSNLVEFICFTLIPLASLLSLGKVFGSKGFGNMLYGVVISIFLFTTYLTFFGEYAGIPAITSLGTLYTGNILGKEVAIGISQSSIFSTGAVFTSTGAANSVLLAFTPAGLIGLFGNLLLNDPLGGVGTGVMNMFTYVIFAMFITSLMIGKLPELMGLKIGSREIRYSTLSLVTHPLLILIPFGITMIFPSLIIGDPNPKIDIISQILYEFASAASNNGSEIGGFMTNTAYFNILDGVIMILGRYLIMGLQLLIAQSFAFKSPKIQFGRSVDPASPLFGLMLFSTLILVGVLSFFPLLALGPFLQWARDFNFLTAVILH